MNHNSNAKEEYMEIDLLRLFKALWHRLWAIVLAAIVCGGIGFSYAKFLITPLYKASALMYVNNSSFSVGNTSFSISSGDLTAAKTLVDTYMVILNSRTTLNDVIQKADLDYTYEQLSGMINTSAVNGTEIFRITVTSSDPQEAEHIANTIAEVLPGKIASIVDGSSVRVVDHAVVPANKCSPSITKYAAMGAVLGIILSSCVIIVLELMDDQIHDEDYLIQTYGLPVLAVIPDLSSSASGGSYYNSDAYGYGYGQNQNMKEKGKRE